LPGHKLPFGDAQKRIEELQLHHAERCDLILNACHAKAKTYKSLYKILFVRPLDFNQHCHRRDARAHNFFVSYTKRN
jgi:hypothetical protein